MMPDDPLSIEDARERARLARVDGLSKEKIAALDEDVLRAVIREFSEPIHRRMDFLERRVEGLETGGRAE